MLMDGIFHLQYWLKIYERSCSYLARKCEVSPVAVHYWLKRKHEPSEKHKKIIKDLTGVEL